MNTNNSGRVAVVTGANRGLGFETSRQLAKHGYTVVLTARSEEKGRQAVEKLKSEGLRNVHFHKLDVTRSEDIRALREFLEKQFGRTDVLVNNAGVLGATPGEWDLGESTVFKTELDQVRSTLESNVYGPLQLCQQLIPLMKKNGYGRVVNLSSGMGQLSDMNGGWFPYRLSKTGVNVVTRVFADELHGTNILINSVCPGWVKTDMGGPEAELTPEQGVDTIVWLAMLPDGGPSGGFFREREPIEW